MLLAEAILRHDRWINSSRYSRILSTRLTKAGSIEIPGYNNYNWLVIIYGGDSNNANSLVIPRGLYDSISLPLTISSKNESTYNDGESYSVAIQGSYKSGVITVSYLNLTLWSSAVIDVYGMY